MIVIFSSARSGSTWLGKIFDSHPDVVYLHEPDIVDQGLDLLPFWFEREPSKAEVEAADTYLSRLTTARSSRATGTRPFLPKHYRGHAAEIVRRALIFLTKACERVGLEHLSDRVRIPDFASSDYAISPVIKSVSALGRADAFIKARGGSLRPILLLRHPCGVVNSMLRGKKMGAMTYPSSLGRLLDTRAAQRLGVVRSSFSPSTDAETLAWEWLLSNSEAYEAIRRAGGAIVIYETLASDVVNQTKALFRQSGLSWATETENFLLSSAKNESGYYSVFREDPVRVAAAWREQLDQETIDRVRAVVSRDPIGQMFFSA